MNTNEQKTLGQILWEAQNNSPIPTWDNWLNSEQKEKWERLASVVEQEVLERLGSGWVLLQIGDIICEGDEYCRFDCKWLPVGSTNFGQTLNEGHLPMRRRIRRTETKAEPEWVPKFKVGDEVRGKTSGADMVIREVVPNKGYRMEDYGDLTWREDVLEFAPKSPFLTPEELRAMLGGRIAHREDGWRREWLTDGWRPLFRSEHDENGDQQRIRGDWQTLEDCGFATGPLEHHCRTKRSLPLPPTTEQKPEGESRLDGIREFWDAQRAFVPASSESPPQGTDVLPESDGFWKDKCLYLEGLRDRITKERDEAREAFAERDSAYGSVCRENQTLSRIGLEQRTRAERAEKKLAEVEAFMKWTLLGAYPSNLEGKALRDAVCSKLDAETIALKDEANALRQKLQQAEASVRQWVPVSTRVPTIKDADQHGNVWALAKDEVFAEVPWNVSYMDRLLCWMTPIPSPLSTPTEEKEDAFMKWYMSIDPSPQQDAQKMMQLRTAFEAGSASNSPLTKD